MSHTILHRRLGGLSCMLALILSAGCGEEVLTSERLDLALSQSQAGIMGGYEDTEDTAVVGLVSFSNRNFGICSGTLIAPNVVLTAQHCVAPTSTEGVVCGQTYFGSAYNASGLYITTQPAMTRDPRDYWESAEVFVTDSSDFCGNDIAILVLREPVDESYATPRIPRVDTPIERYDGYYAVGYGSTSDAGGGSGVRRRRDNLVIDCVGSECPSWYVTKEELVGDTGACTGDSGGPAFDSLGRVVGILSRGSLGCDMPIYTHVEPWGDWIKEKVVYATQGAGIETPEWALGLPTDPVYTLRVGAACSQDSDCESYNCLDGYCTRPCNDNAPCPNAYVCDESLGSEGLCVSSYTLRVGEVCTDGRDCLSGLCHDGYCSRPCNNGAPCPDYYACSELLNYCVMESDPAATATKSGDDEGGCSATQGGSWVWLMFLLGSLALMRSRERPVTLQRVRS
ncbi:MAG: trypsin-like serine protease [Myxococcota bacterium]|nr:trypsin-like serine protease [Myxococcota bacterium]